MQQNRNRKKQIFAVAMLLFLILPLQAFSQASNASLRGTVVDPSGGILQNANITLTNDANERSVKTVSDSEPIRVIGASPQTSFSETHLMQPLAAITSRLSLGNRMTKACDKNHRALLYGL